MSASPNDLKAFAWPTVRLAEAIEWLARRSDLAPHTVELPAAPSDTPSSAALTNWFNGIGHSLGIEIEPIDNSYSEADALVKRSAPALLQVQFGSEAQFLAVLPSGSEAVRLLSPDLNAHRVDPEAVRAMLCQQIEKPLVAETEKLLEEAGVAPARRPAALTVILRQQLAGMRIGGCWLLRSAPSASIWRQAREARIPLRLLALLGAHAIQYLLWLVSWWMIGQAALLGRFDWGWLTAWALVLFSMVPFRLLVTWWQGLLSIRVGALLKRSLLFGALQLQPDEIRHQGAGQLLGCVIESEAVESLALSGGFLAVMAGLELALAAGVIALGLSGFLLVPLLLVWIAVALGLAWHYSRNRDWWTRSRLKITNELVERMVGHRTRLAQQRRDRWHDGEDQAVSGLLTLALGMDRSALWLTAIVPRGWLVLGLLALTPSFAMTNNPPAKLAIALGGVLLAFRALQRFAGGLSHIAGAVIAWKQIAPLFGAAKRGNEPNTSMSNGTHGPDSARAPELLEAHDLNFCYRDRGLPVLRACSLKIRPGDRILLEGPSGGGKSTLASMLTGLRVPDSGLLLLRGLDRHTIGLNGWRRHVVAAPQFHENHVLTGTFAFNLLMGGCWPPEPEALEKAEALCRELGLEDLLQRMPAGLLQLVGESGWQLSHGEKSRLYIARALLQGAELVVLDESFASLDPENLRRTLKCVLSRARTLVVIAHP